MRTKQELQLCLDKLNDWYNGNWRNHNWIKMTNEEVNDDISNSLDGLQELVDKETPMKPVCQDEYDDYGTCPICNSSYIYDYEYSREHKRCPECGQTIEWPGQNDTIKELSDREEGKDERQETSKSNRD